MLKLKAHARGAALEKGGGGKPPEKPSAGSTKTFAEMAAEFLREAAVLVAVFGWLDAFGKKDSLPRWWEVGVTAFAAALFIAGTAVELHREPK